MQFLSEKEFKTLISNVNELRLPGENYGTALLNIAINSHPKLVEPLIGSEVDCYNCCRNINPFLKRITDPSLHNTIDKNFY